MQDDPEGQRSAPAAGLADLSPAEIAAFKAAFQRQMTRANTWDLWGAAHVINGGASDDGFEYFRCWLISRGCPVFDGAVADPDSLATLPPPDVESPAQFEEFSCVAGDVWARKTGRGFEDFRAATPDAAALDAMMALTAAAPKGEPFAEEEDHLAGRYPQLRRRFGANRLERSRGAGRPAGSAAEGLRYSAAIRSAAQP